MDLNPNILPQLDTVLSRCSYLEQLLGLCGQAGLQTDDWVRKNRQCRDRTMAIRQAYFPSAPPPQMQTFNHPLNDDHYQILNQVLQGASVADDAIAQAQAAGVTVTKHYNDNARLKQIAEGVKRAFFPNRP